MSDKPPGPGWWIASDGRWYPPELHPSVREGSATEAGTEAGATTGSPWSGPERRGPEDRRRSEATPGGGAGAEAGATTGSTWSGPERRWGDRRKSDGSEPVGPQFPDLFQKAMQGSHLADNVSVRYDDDRAAPPGSDRKGRTPAASAAAGNPGPGPKRRRRKGG